MLTCGGGGGGGHRGTPGGREHCHLLDYFSRCPRGILPEDKNKTD